MCCESNNYKKGSRHFVMETKPPARTISRFPTDPIVAARWVEKIRQNRKEKCWNPTKYTNICSVHFDEEEKYVTEGEYCKLRRGAVPTKICTLHKGLHIYCTEERHGLYETRDRDQIQVQLAQKMQKAELAKTNSSLDHQNLEWLKNKLGTLWRVPKYCGLCLETMGNFYPMKMEFAINECYSPRPLREIISAVLRCDIEDYTSSEIICEQCTEKTIQSYVFIENTKKIFSILSSCVNDLLSKTTDLNNEFDENGAFEAANVMIVVEYDKETYGNIEKLTTGNNIILAEKLIKRHEDKINTAAPKKDKLIEIPKNKSKQNKGPVIIPTPRVIKHPRTKEVSKELKPTVEVETPAVSLEGGKIVIAPLNTTTSSALTFNTYKCFSCPSIFTTFRSLKEHEKSLHNTTIYQCRLCSKKYIAQQSLDVHYSSVHSKSRCRHCHNLFNNNEFNSHLREKHADQVNGCKYCDFVYYTVEQLETHCKSAHMLNDLQSSNNLTQCVMCLKNFKDVKIKLHKCKFSCLECPVVPCIHYSYLISFREQVLSHCTRIKCLDCDFSTKRKENLIAHANREHLDYHPHTCDDCGTQFYTKLSLRTHIVQFHQNMQCQYCDHEFKSKQLLENHIELCKDVTRMFSCKQCVASFDTEPELEKHTRFYHSDIVFPCTLCKREFSKELSLKQHHARVHKGIQSKKRRKFFECTLCDITFTSLKEMIEHEELHEPNESFPCKFCRKSFDSLKKLHVHKQRHYTQKTKCLGCKKLVTTSYFSQHKAVCKYLKPHKLQHVCSECGMSFLTKYALYVHKKLHQKPCKYCNKLVTSSMEKHIAYNHLKKLRPVFKCDYCDYTTPEKCGFENHINKIHLKIKPYICHICSKAFCGKSRLAEHVKTHTDQYVCFCSYCGKKFANKVCLKMHVRHHTGEKRYECDICFDRFESSSTMKKHRLIKHQDKTIQCPLCGFMFHLLAEMRRHVKKVHWKRPEPFDYKQLVSEEYYHMFEDQRLQKLGENA